MLQIFLNFDEYMKEKNPNRQMVYIIQQYTQLLVYFGRYFLKKYSRHVDNRFVCNKH